MIYQNSRFSFDGTKIVEGDRTAKVVGSALIDSEQKTHLDVVPLSLPQVNSMVPMMDALYRVSYTDLNALVVDRKTYLYGVSGRKIFGPVPGEEFACDSHYFWVGRNFNTLVYTRDIAYSSYLGAAFLFPQIIKEHLRYTRKLRKALGFKVSKTHKIPIDSIKQEVLDISESEFARIYNTNSVTRRTDDVVWVLGYWECCKMLGRRSDLSYLMEEFDYFDTHFYVHFYDTADGLYRGQPSFIDVGGSGYPGLSNQQGILVKALSTNCLYARAFDIMAAAARQLHLPEREAEFKARSASIKTAILNNFKDKDGIYRYYISPDGTLSDRQEVLGMAFLTLFDILPEDAVPAFDGYPKNEFGFPLLWPFYNNKEVYHNNSTWPFADMMLYLAMWKQSRDLSIPVEALAKFSRHAFNGNFNEVLEYATGDFHGGKGYIWSSAAYLSIIFRMIAGIDTESYGKICFDPCLPEELGDTFILSHVTVQDCSFDLYLHGNGSHCKKMTIDGAPVSVHELIPDEKHHVIHCYF